MIDCDTGHSVEMARIGPPFFMKGYNDKTCPALSIENTLKALNFEIGFVSSSDDLI